MKPIINIEAFRQYYEEAVNCKTVLNANAENLSLDDERRLDALLPIYDEHGRDMVKRLIVNAIRQDSQNYSEQVRKWADNAVVAMFIYETDNVLSDYIPDHLSEAALVGLMMAIYMLRAAGVIEMLTEVLSPLLERAGMTAEVLPLALLRPVSGSASIAIVSDIFKQLGPDSASGRIASVMMGSTETTFYVIAVYFGAAGIKNTRHAVPAALIADFTGIVMAVAVTRLFFNC